MLPSSDLFALIQDYQTRRGQSYHGPPRTLSDLERLTLASQLTAAAGNTHDNGDTVAGQLAALADAMVVLLTIAEQHGFAQFNEAVRRRVASLLDGPEFQVADLVDPELLKGHEAPPDASLARPERLVGLIGGIGVGKSTVANYMALKHGFAQRSFAKKLKEVCFDVFGALGMPREAFFGSQEEKLTMHRLPGGRCNGRTILELVGTDGFREAYPQIWVDYLFATLEGNSVIEDVRFPNEADLIRERGGEIWRIVRLNNPNPQTEHASCISEKLIEPDAVLVAHSSRVDQLFVQVNTLLS